MADSVPATREARQYGAESFQMTGRLRRLYALLFAPALGLFALLFLAQKTGLAPARPATHVSPALAALVFGIAVLCSLALPMVLRGAFVYAHRNATSTREADYVRLQRRTLSVSSVAAYLAVAAAYLEFPRVPFAGTALAGIAAAYYSYPSAPKLRRDRRVFRIR